MVATLLVVLTLGLHWALLQSFAWAGMFARFLQTDSPAQALTKTFDGRHPCALCKLVRQATHANSPDRPRLRPAPLKLEACWLGTAWWLPPPPPVRETVFDLLPTERLRPEPLTPPPREA